MMKKDTLRNKRIGDAELAQVAGGSGSKPKTKYTVYCEGLVPGMDMSCGFESEGFTSYRVAEYYREQNVHCPNCKNGLLGIRSYV